MKEFIKKSLREQLNKIIPIQIDINDIEDDELYDSIMSQAEKLKSNGEISFNAELFNVIYDDNNKELIAATWLENSPSVFSPHIMVSNNYRGGSLNGVKFVDMLINRQIKKYNTMRSVRGDDFLFLINLVNDDLKQKLLRFGFEQYKDQPKTFIYQPNN